MIRCNTLARRLRKGIVPGLAIAAIHVTVIQGALGADAKSTNVVATATGKETRAKAAPKKLTGAELYAVNCNRCHPERYPTEFNPAQWKSVMLHMRVRADLPAKQARQILKYLQDEGGN
jgi:cytochrome c5